VGSVKDLTVIEKPLKNRQRGQNLLKRRAGTRNQKQTVRLLMNYIR
jgi:hypothetical protein